MLTTCVKFETLSITYNFFTFKNLKGLNMNSPEWQFGE